VISTEITYANNLDRIETIRADGMIDGAPKFDRIPSKQGRSAWPGPVRSI